MKKFVFILLAGLSTLITTNSSSVEAASEGAPALRNASIGVNSPFSASDFVERGIAWNERGPDGNIRTQYVYFYRNVNPETDRIQELRLEPPFGFGEDERGLAPGEKIEDLPFFTRANRTDSTENMDHYFRRNSAGRGENLRVER